jgi:hypothetical protein
MSSILEEPAEVLTILYSGDSILFLVHLSTLLEIGKASNG